MNSINPAKVWHQNVIIDTTVASYHIFPINIYIASGNISIRFQQKRRDCFVCPEDSLFTCGNCAKTNGNTLSCIVFSKCGKGLVWLWFEFNQILCKHPEGVYGGIETLLGSS